MSPTGAVGKGNTGLIGIPKTGGNGLAGLAAMVNFRVVDNAGKEIGTVQDFVVNPCEAHILYIVVNPSAAVGVSAGQQVLIPYEALLETPNQGKVDSAKGEFVLNVSASDLTSVPAIDLTTVDLESPDWDVDMMTFWKSHFRLALTTACNIPQNGTQGGGAVGTAVPSVTGTPGTAAPEAVSTLPAGTVTPTPSVGTNVQATKNPDRQAVYKVVLASKLLTAPLQEGNGRALGKVQDAAIVLNTGRVQYIVIQPDASVQNSSIAHMVALPPGAVNVMYESNSDQPVLVLLVDTTVLENAPAFDVNASWNDQSWFNYWSQYIPMTLQQTP